jgi:hypothetical protein
VLNRLWKDGIKAICFGYGPGSLTRSILDSEYYVDYRIAEIRASYGITGMTFTLTEYGLFGLIPIGMIFIIFIFRSIKWFNIETDPYWKAFATGNVVFSVLVSFIFFTYNVIPLLGDTIPPLYFYAMAVGQIRMQQLKLTQNNVQWRFSQY